MITEAECESPYHLQKSINTDFSCCAFYEKIKSNKDFWRKYCLRKSIIGRM